MAIKGCRRRRGDIDLKRKRFGLVFTVMFALSVSNIVQVVHGAYLMPDDFKQESWSKVVDYLEYVDAYAPSQERPPAGARANLYMAYVNYRGLQMLYAGLSNITMGLGRFTVTLPIQTFMMHYKTQGQRRDVVVASSYMMLLAYNETQGTIFSDSPDKNDTLFASFSLGFDLSSLISTDAPALNSKTTIIRLTHPESNRWHWGMTYENLAAIWWLISIDPENASYTSIPVAVSVYEELTFTYDLIFNEENNTAVVESNYVIGRMNDLWAFDKANLVHYNSTGGYRLNKSKYSDETIYQFLHRHGISMSIVLFQASAMLDQTTQSAVNTQNPADNELIVSDDTISTFSEDGEKIFDADFSVKNTYALHNYTSGASTTYNATTRTAQRRGFARNTIFNIHTFLMRYIPLALAHIDEPLYKQARNRLLNMTYADYFYIISYPTYDGYRIEHDPTYTAYLTLASAPASNPLAGLIILALIALVIVVAGLVIVKRRTKSPADSL